MRHLSEMRFNRYLCISFFILTFLMVVFLSSGCTEKKATASNLKIGLLEEPKTLNVWLASDTWSRKVLSQLYQPLYIRDPQTLRFVPWLAEAEPLYDEKNLCYTIKIRSAKWSDGSPVTSEDVAFTGRFIQEFKVPRYASKWSFIEKIETPDAHTVKFYLEEPKAIFVTRTLTTPIVQKKEWERIAEEAKKAEKPLTALLNHKIEIPVSSGPFVLQEWKQGAYLFLKKNEYFFAKNKEINGRLLGPYVDGIIFKIFGTSDAAVLALQKGTIDMFWWGIQSGYLEELGKAEDVRVFLNEKSALYYMGFNLKQPPLDDIHLRQAIATLIDKDFIVERVLQGRGIKMNSIVPPGNQFWHCPALPLYGEGLPREERVKRVFENLSMAGYKWEVPPVDGLGNVVQGKGIMMPDGSAIKKITILTPPADYDPQRAMAGMIVQEWLRAAGIPASAKPMAFSSLTEQVKVRREFDAFILGYGNLSLDPDYLRSFFHSRNDKVRGRNTSGYVNAEFDRISDESAGTMDREARRRMVWQMQKMIARDVPWIPLYNPHLVEATRSERFTDWVEMLGGIGNLWSFCQVKPVKD